MGHHFTPNNMKIAISGGGIAGLTTAIALQKIGLSVDVYESAPIIKPLGAGIVLASNAVRAFQEIGIADSILPEGKMIDSMVIRNQKGKALTQSAGASLKKVIPGQNLAIHRAALHQVLIDQLPENAIHLGKRITAFTELSNCVQLHFANGETEQVDYLLACDGIHSPIRQQIFPDIHPRYAGYTCWRAIVHLPDLDYPQASETWGKGGRMGIVPLKDGYYYWFACLSGPANDPKLNKFSTAELLEAFGKYHAPIPEVLRQTPAESIIHGDICDLPPLPHYANGRVLLMGDAAHATTPNMGQGACQAIEDAVILAKEWSILKNPQAAFQSFNDRRMARTQGIIRQSAKIGQLAQSSNPIVIALRNTLFRLIPPSIQAKQLKKVLDVEF